MLSLLHTHNKNSGKMKKSAFILLLCAALSLPTLTKAQYQFGYLSYQTALEQMPEYQTAQESLQTLQAKYEEEADYNDTKFQRMFADFLAGQKTFPQEIMLKRQKELQTAMEDGIAFRDEAARQLKSAEEQLLAPLKEKLATALSEIGTAYGFIFIVNTDGNDFPFIHTMAGKDVQQDVVDRLNGKPINVIQLAIEEEQPAAEPQPQPAEPEQQSEN